MKCFSDKNGAYLGFRVNSLVESKLLSLDQCRKMDCLSVFYRILFFFISDAISDSAQNFHNLVPLSLFRLQFNITRIIHPHVIDLTPIATNHFAL